jgi:hypothetical protein
MRGIDGEFSEIEPQVLKLDESLIVKNPKWPTWVWDGRIPIPPIRCRRIHCLNIMRPNVDDTGGQVATDMIGADEKRAGPIILGIARGYTEGRQHCERCEEMVKVLHVIFPVLLSSNEIRTR